MVGIPIVPQVLHDCDIGEVLKGFLTTRMYHFNFMFKILALCINFYCLDTFKKGVEERALPVYSSHATALFYFTIPTYNIILTLICLLFIINQIPSRTIQKVYLLTGIAMYIISGAMGIVNTRDNDFLPEMFVMSCLLLAVAAAMIFDFIILSDYFVPHHRRIRHKRPSWVSIGIPDGGSWVSVADEAPTK